MRLLQLFKTIAGIKSSRDYKRYWLFYAGPENYLCETGVRDLPVESFWSCDPGTQKGDLIIVYRKSKNQLKADTLMSCFGMSRDVAVKAAKTDAGKDFPVIWEATSNSKRKLFWRWSYGCSVKEVRKISPPLRLEQLKAIPQLKKWEGLRFNLQAKGRSALPIPAFAWRIINDAIEGGAKNTNGASTEKTEP